MACAEQIVVGDDHSVTSVLKLRLSVLTIAFGRRCLETPLSPDWAAYTVYRVIKDGGGGLMVQSRFTSVRKTIKASELMRVDMQFVYVKDKYSEHRATLKAKGTVMNILLAPIFEPSAFQALAADACAPPAKRRRRPLGIGEWSAAVVKQATSAQPPLRRASPAQATVESCELFVVPHVTHTGGILLIFPCFPKLFRTSVGDLPDRLGQ